MKNFNIIEYEPKYAKSVADMWVRSSEGWNGFYADMTEEKVLKEHEKSTSINIYLAEKNGEICGYCDLSLFNEESDTLYIKTLNVRYDLHGQGIGKLLVNKAIERTIELGYPRLDLYTWSSNKKSIPLYKKCGFFFENRKENNHFMNFIPYVFKVEAIKDYFDNFNWYSDMKRNTDLKPDGYFKNGFEIFEYKWENENSILRIEFEKSSRGIKLIETDDYIVSANVQNHELICGINHDIFYEITNKTGKELNIDIKGVDNKNIKHDFSYSGRVIGKEKIDSSFFVSYSDEKVQSSKIHPSVTADIIINNKKCTFKIGIMPKLPAEIKLSGTISRRSEVDSETFKNKISNLWIDIENFLEVPAKFNFSLTNNENIDFIKAFYSVQLNPKEKTSIELPYILKNFGVYSEDIKVEAYPEKGDKIEFNSKLFSIFRGHESMFGGELEDSYVLINNNYSLKLGKNINNIFFREFDKENSVIFIKSPAIGKPFINEFHHMKPDNVEWYPENNKIVLKYVFSSSLYKDLKLINYFKLNSNGILEHYFELFNDSEITEIKDLYLLDNIYFPLKNTILPLNNKIIRIENEMSEEYENINPDKIHENWIFGRNDTITYGLFWDKNFKPSVDESSITFEYKIDVLMPKKTYRIDAAKIAVNTFNSWNRLRQYALSEASNNTPALSSDTEIIFNEGNPFVDTNFKLYITEHKNTFIEGNYFIFSLNNSLEEKSISFDEKDELKNAGLTLDINQKHERDIITVESDQKFIAYEKEKILFYKNGEIKNSFSNENNIYLSDNGKIKIKISPDFSYGLFSLVYNNREWLDTSYPEPVERSWFNPWFGGSMLFPDEFIDRPVIEDSLKTDFSTLSDSLGNEWNGIKTHYKINEDCQINGLEITTHYLMFPGVPVLCITSEIYQNTGKYMNNSHFELFNFFRFDEDNKNNYVIMKNQTGKPVRYKCGTTAINSFSDYSILYGSKNISDKIQLYTSTSETKLMTFLNPVDTACFIPFKITAANKEKIFTTPVFLIFTEEYIEDDLLIDFNNIKFDI